MPLAEEPPHVVAILGSPRRKGNSAALLGAALAELELRGATVETIHLSAHDIRYCAGHDDCADRERCPIADDAAELLERFFDADVAIVASPCIRTTSVARPRSSSTGPATTTREVDDFGRALSA